MPLRLRLAFLAATALLSMARAQTVFYINGPQATGANTGTGWPDAFRGEGALQRAFDTAAPIAAGGQTVQLWVAAGTYTPTARGDPTQPDSVSFVLGSREELYGGFVGNET